MTSLKLDEWEMQVVKDLLDSAGPMWRDTKYNVYENFFHRNPFNIQGETSKRPIGDVFGYDLMNATWKVLIDPKTRIIEHVEGIFPQYEFDVKDNWDFLDISDGFIIVFKYFNKNPFRKLEVPEEYKYIDSVPDFFNPFGKPKEKIVDKKRIKTSIASFPACHDRYGQRKYNSLIYWSVVRALREKMDQYKEYGEENGLKCLYGKTDSIYFDQKHLRLEQGIEKGTVKREEA